MRVNRGSLLSLIVLSSVLTTNLCWAQQSDSFSAFPESCATEARARHDELLKYPRDSGQGGVVWDLKSPGSARTYQTLDAQSKLLVPAAELLFRGSSNIIKPRISNKASKEARRLSRDLDTEPGWWLLYAGLPDPQFTETMDEFQCITDSCPQGFSCTTLDVKKSGEGLLNLLPRVRRKAFAIYRWADSVKIFGSKVSRLRKAYERDEGEIKELIAGLPPKLVVISVTVPIN